MHTNDKFHWRQILPRPSLPAPLWWYCALWVACAFIPCSLIASVPWHSFDTMVVIATLLLLESILLLHYFCARLTLRYVRRPLVQVVWLIVATTLSFVWVFYVSKSLPSVWQNSSIVGILLFCLLIVHLFLFLAHQIHSWQFRAEMARLSPQINQHALFNTLNTTVHHISTSNIPLAQDTLIKMAEFYRQMLGQKTLVSIQEEIQMADHYIQLQKLRFGEHLCVSWNVLLQANTNARVPSMLLQPLIENSITHGASLLPNGGIIEIKVKEDKNSISFTINNPIVCSAQPSSHSNHIAHSNIHARLKCLYGTNYQFFYKKNNGQFCLKVQLPKEAIYEYPYC